MWIFNNALKDEENVVYTHTNTYILLSQKNKVGGCYPKPESGGEILQKGCVITVRWAGGRWGKPEETNT